MVLQDENNFSADELQRSTYFLCYLYPRCLKSLSIPPFVAYAHLLCTRGAKYIKYFDNLYDQSSTNSGDNGKKLSDA